MEHAHWRVKGRRRVFSEGPVREIVAETVELPDGREIADYYRIALPDFALVFATTEDERVVLLRHYKHGVGRVCFGFPGGAVDEGEKPLEAAKRELLEETGYVSDRWRSLGGFVTNSNQRCNVAHLFVADECRRSGEPAQPDLEAPDILLVPRTALLSTVSPASLGAVAHLALLALATHPELSHASTNGAED